MTILPSLRKSLYASFASASGRFHSRRYIYIPTSNVKTDSCGLPVQPTWSVNELLSSYPSPKLPPHTIARLYKLSALVCPEKNTPKFELVKEELEDMIKLVEAVRLVDTSGITIKGRGEKEDADRQISYRRELGESGRDLLKHASRTLDDEFYVVDAERRC